MGRPKHPDAELRKLIRSLERQGWRVIKGKYYKAYCPTDCGEKHKKTIHISPSSSKYVLNLKKELLRRTCWKEDQ